MRYVLLCFVFWQMRIWGTGRLITSLRLRPWILAQLGLDPAMCPSQGQGSLGWVRRRVSTCSCLSLLSFCVLLSPFRPMPLPSLLLSLLMYLHHLILIVGLSKAFIFQKEGHPFDIFSYSTTCYWALFPPSYFVLLSGLITLPLVKVLFPGIIPILLVTCMLTKVVRNT